MKQYLLSIYHAGDEPPPPEVLDPIMRNLDALNQEIKAAGALGVRRRAAPAEHRHRAACHG